ncbi:hypothetical protein ACFFGH_06645 [Lysobacter korlensis]|uniref:Phage tail protein n=1 Tax=Lysobacter korlensis TaxID=553636 RepID=A0ABV6RNL6_9GAMM
MLALALGKTIGELQASMGEAEFDAWREFYRLYPFDDLHRFHRPAALMACSGVSGSLDQAIEQRLKWLQPDPSDRFADTDALFFGAAEP